MSALIETLALAGWAATGLGLARGLRQRAKARAEALSPETLDPGVAFDALKNIAGHDPLTCGHNNPLKCVAHCRDAALEALVAPWSKVKP